jgi:hypothetical protein
VPSKNSQSIERLSRLTSKRRRIRLHADLGLNEILLITPLLKHLRTENPASELVIYCRDQESAAAIENNPHIDSIIWFKPRVQIEIFCAWVIGLLRSALSGCAQIEGSQSRSVISISLNECEKMPTAEPPVQHRIVVSLTESEIRHAQGTLRDVRNPLALFRSPPSTENGGMIGEQWTEIAAQFSHITFVQFGVETEDLIEGAIDARGLSVRRSLALLSQCIGYVGHQSYLLQAATGFGLYTLLLVANHDTSSSRKTKRCVCALDGNSEVDFILNRSVPHSLSVFDCSTAELRQALHTLFGCSSSPFDC